MRITMIGHSTILLEGAETRLITDPYFGTFGHLAYARLRPPAFKREDLRDVDGVLVSHTHWDHTDRKFFIPIHLGVQPRSFLLRNGQSVQGFERRLRAAGLGTEVVHLHEGEHWDPAEESAGRSVAGGHAR